MATTWPVGPQGLDPLVLVAGADPRLDVVDAQSCRATAPGRLLVVAGEHDDVQAQRVERPDGLGRGLLDRIGHGQQAGDAAVDGDEHDRIALAAASRAAWSSRSSASSATPVFRRRKPALPTRTRRPCRRVPRRPPPVIESKSVDSAQRQIRGPWRLRGRPGPADVRWPARPRRPAAGGRLRRTGPGGDAFGQLAAALR